MKLFYQVFSLCLLCSILVLSPYYSQASDDYNSLEAAFNELCSQTENAEALSVDVIKSMIRLFVLWNKSDKKETTIEYDRIMVPEITISSMFNDSFRAISRDGAGDLSVSIWLQKAFYSLSKLECPEIQIR